MDNNQKNNGNVESNALMRDILATYRKLGIHQTQEQELGQKESIAEQCEKQAPFPDNWRYL